MVIGIIQASSQKDKNPIIERCVKEAAPQHETVNFGVYEGDETEISYIKVAVCISLLLESGSVDFVVTGCSSGQGMALACSSLGVICGYVQNVTDAYLFGRINDGNAVSYPLGFNWGWAAEVNFRETMKALFCEPMGNGYPKADAERKMRDTRQLKEINRICRRELAEILPLIDGDMVRDALNYGNVYRYISEHGKNPSLMQTINDVLKKNHGDQDSAF